MTPRGLAAFLFFFATVFFLTSYICAVYWYGWVHWPKGTPAIATAIFVFIAESVMCAGFALVCLCLSRKEVKSA